MNEQLGLISAVLGGFAFSFFGIILSKDDSRKIMTYTFVMSVISAMIFFVCALGWTFMSGRTEMDMDTAIIASKHRFLSILFMIGVLTLTICLGLSGWIRSKKLGVLTAIIGIIGIVCIIYVLKDFIN